MSQQERSGWRDQWISGRHRTWGWNVPAVDLDCVLTEGGEVMDGEGWKAVEYDMKEPVAIIEYKAYGATVRLNDANNTTLRRLADRADLPFFIVLYSQEKLLFGVVPMNEKARELCPERTVYREPQYVEFLHRIRGRSVHAI